MTQQLLSIGTVANDGTGDTLRTAGTKINSNFTELYQRAAIPSIAGQTGKVLSTDGTGIFWTSSSTVNAVQTTGSYNDPTWLTGLSYSKLINAPQQYTLPTAATNVLGGVKVDGATITINSGTISAVQYSLPTATTGVLGGVKVDGTTITISNGVISAPVANYTLPAATTLALGGVIIPAVATSGITNTSGSIGLAVASNTQLGGVKVDGTTITISNGVISAPYVVPTATVSQLGAVKPDGTTITINGGVLTAANGAYSLPTASTNVLGGVKVDGSTITIANGIITANYTNYTLPTASTSALGGVKVDGSTITLNGSNQLVATIPTATTSVLGGVIADGTTIGVTSGTISALASNIRAVAAAMFTGGSNTGLTFSYNSGTGLMTSTNTGGSGSGIQGVTIQSGGATQGTSAGITTVNFTGTGVVTTGSGSTATVTINASNYSLPAATSSALGGVIVPAVATSGITNSTGTIGLAVASTTQLGGVKIDGTSITLNGSNQLVATAYTLPAATTSVLGGVIVDGTTITASGGTISAVGNSRNTVSTTTTTLSSAASVNATVTMAKGYALYSIQVSAGAWVTLYSSSTAQSNDSGRSITTDPTPGSGVIAETITTTATTTYFSPAVFGYNSDGTVSTNAYLKIYNNSGSSTAITVTLTYLKLEV